MGCWNVTDGFGGLSIGGGDKVKVVIIENNIYQPDPSGFYYASGISTAISFVIDAEYDEYGGIENVVENASSKLLFSFINTKLEDGSIKVKDNTYGVDWDVNKDESFIKELGDDISLKEFINHYINRGLVVSKRHGWLSDKNSWVSIGSMFFSDFLYQKIVKNVNLFEYTFDENDKPLKENIEKYCIDTFDNDDDDDKVTMVYFNYFRGDGTNKISCLSSTDNVSEDFLIYYTELLENYKDYKDYDVPETLETMVNLIYIMRDLRLCWTPQTGRGGQDCQYKTYGVLADGIKEQSILYGKMYEEYDEDEED